MAEVVAPAMGTRRVYYQAKPSLRVQVPGAKGIRYHTDREYYHQSGEVTGEQRLRDAAAALPPPCHRPTAT